MKKRQPQNTLKPNWLIFLMDMVSGPNGFSMASLQFFYFEKNYY